jgi:hypothetical protein
MDYNPEEGITLNFWDAHPEIPKPQGYTYNTRDGRRNMDICTLPWHPIRFAMEEGRVTQNRHDDGVLDMVDGVLDILITRGPGTGLIITYGHINPDVDPSVHGLQYLLVGSVVHSGDIIGYTQMDPGGSPWSILNFGVIDRDLNDYHPDQEMMYIGLDGQPNLLD